MCKVIFLNVKQWDGVLFIWDFPTTLILSQGGVVGLTARNGDAREMLFLTKNIVSGMSTEDVIVQESLWKVNLAIPSPEPPTPPLSFSPHRLPRWFRPTVHPTILASRTTNLTTCSMVHLILLQLLILTGDGELLYGFF